MGFQSRHGQDKWVLKMLNGKKRGYFVDIGASDGIANSNSYTLEKKYDWNGICIEPNPKLRAFQRLSKNRTCVCENVCIYSKKMEVDFVARGRRIEASGIYADSINNAIKDIVERKKHTLLKVPAITLMELLEKNNAPTVIDYLSIDTEGCEWEILKNFDFKKYMFLTLTIENNYDGSEKKKSEKEKRDNIRKLMEKNGYILKEELQFGEDWFVHKSVDEKDPWMVEYASSYLLERFPDDFFDYLIDVGACVGTISKMFSRHHPKAKIIAIEPSREQYDKLLENTEKVSNITPFNIALGNGDDLYFQDHIIPGQDAFVEGELDTYKVKSKTLYDIFVENNVDLTKKICLKMDCEGGERFLINDEKSIEIMKECEHIAMEIHFCHRRGRETPWFNTNEFPDYPTYSEWIEKNFKDDYNILYHKSRKTRGMGHYVLTKQKYDYFINGLYKKSFWNGKFTKEIKKNYKISFCTTCMGRLYNLKQTLSVNMKDNKDYPDLEFIVLDYNSNDNLSGWMKKHMMKHIKSGRVTYYRTVEPKYFSMAHSRNIAFKVATGDIVNNLDADNYTKDYTNNLPIDECWASYLNRMANECNEKVIFSKGKRGMRGRIGFFREEFINILGGYDENLEGYGHDDHDLVKRAWALGFTMYWWGGKYYSRIKTSSKEKNQNLRKHWKKTEDENKIKSANNIKNGILKANEGKHWGKAKLYKNFSSEGFYI